MTESQVQADEDTRQAIRTRLDETLFVEAGAGTGKTSELVRRVLALVESGRTPITQVAAITFTEAAAADLRRRIHDELVTLANGSDSVWAREALGGLDDASMTTIHGFAQRILGEHPLEAGLPLRFRVTDEIESDIDFDERFAAFLESLVADADAGELVAAALAIGLSIPGLKDLAREVDDVWDRHRDNGSSVPTVAELRAEVDGSAIMLTEALRGVLALRDCCLDESDRLVAVIDEMEASLVQTTPEDDWIDRLEWCCAIGPFPSHYGKKAAWAGVAVDEARAQVAAVERLRAETMIRLCGQVLGALVASLGRLAALAAGERRRLGELCFHDLLVFCRDLLAGNEAVRRAVGERFGYLLVDEFQDTDPLQLEIVSLVTCDPETGAAKSGRLFFVGDPRQSIYRFRGAEPELYEAALARLVPEGPMLLTRNFRSVPGIIDWVNAVFGELFVADAGARSAYTPLGATRTAVATGSVIVLGATAEEPLSAGERRAREADEIAEVVKTAIAEGWPVVCDGGERPARLSDIVILVTRRTGLAELEAALDAVDIPFRADAPSLILTSTEVRDMLACLKAVDSPGDEAALIAALRTPLCACGDDDLLRFRRAGGQWRIDLDPGFDRSDPVAQAIDRLDWVAKERFRLGVVGTVEAVAGRFFAFEIAATTRHAEESLRRLNFLVDRAHAFVDAGGATLSGFLDWIEGQIGSRVRSAETAVGDGADAVRILTIHTAKGLEFPVVILAELGADPPRQRNGKKVLFSGEGRPEVRVRKGVETLGLRRAGGRGDPTDRP